MALYDRRTLEGVYSVRQSVVYIQNYRYAEERMMRMMAGWIALTPELAVKLEMAKQVYEDALHTDALGKRLPELRAQPQISKPPNEAFVTFMNALEDKEEWEDTIERLVGIYRVLKPHLISHYSSHVSAMNPVYEPPTLRILQRLVEEEKDTSSAAACCSTSCSTRRKNICAPRIGNRISKDCSARRAELRALNRMNRHRAEKSGVAEQYEETGRYH